MRLTMGGEPTFVSLDDATTAQWSTDADGPEKRLLARDLADRLREEYAGGGVVHRGQGKWYPGEPLPRWNISLQWRTDGVPLWQDPALFAEPWVEGTASDDDARVLAERVTAVLGLPAEQLRPAYEDPFAALADHDATEAELQALTGREYLAKISQGPESFGQLVSFSDLVERVRDSRARMDHLFTTLDDVTSAVERLWEMVPADEEA